jgi:thymidylate synthase (FAD)
MLSSDLRDAVRLVSVTNPSELVKFTEKGRKWALKVSPEELIVYIARVSNPSNQMNMETAPKLINYLIKHKHWSPFEFVDMTVDIVTRRSIAAQILRHKSFSFQEFSQRYSTATEIQPIELRRQGKTNRQSSEDLIQDAELESDIQQHISNSKLLYDKLISNGVSRETARDVLPLATETTMYMKGSVRSWIHYLELRCSSDTQKEHREIAEGIKSIFVNQFPNISEALGWKHGS